MNKNVVYVFFIVLSILFLSGCSGKSGNSVDSGSKDVSDSITEFPLNISDFSDKDVGFTGFFNDLSDDKKDDLLDLSLTKDIETDYASLLNVFHQDYESVKDFLDTLSFEIDDFDGEYSFKDNLNIVILLDASGSMGRLIGGESQMSIAKRVVRDFTNNLPEEANVGLRVYGHIGKGTMVDKELSCSSSDMVFGLDKLDKEKIKEELDKITYSGWTPTGLTFEKVLEEDLKGKDGVDNNNIIVMISDGDSTCEDDPIGKAEKLAKSKYEPDFNIVGFNVDSSGKKELDAITEVTNGVYRDVQNAAQLTEQFVEIEKMANKWKEWLDSIDDEISENSKLNLVSIFNYVARTQQKFIDTGDNINQALDYMKEKGSISEDYYNNLIKINSKYMDLFIEELADLRKDLREVNTENHSKAIEEVEKLLYGN